jgi:hypothetical protein
MNRKPISYESAVNVLVFCLITILVTFIRIYVRTLRRVSCTVEGADHGKILHTQNCVNVIFCFRLLFMHVIFMCCCDVSYKYQYGSDTYTVICRRETDDYINGDK